MRTFEGKVLFEEDPTRGDSSRQKYLNSVNSFIEKKFAEGDRTRTQMFSASDYIQNISHYRKKFVEMIGSPVELYPENIPECKTEFVGEDGFGKMYRCEIEVLPQFWFYGILSVPHKVTKAPLVIAQHGGWGIPELCCDMAGNNNYDFYTKRALQAGMVVFAPQLLLWCFDTETGENRVNVNIPFNRAELDNRLKRLGLSITGLEVFCIRRSIDYLCSLECVDSKRIGMMGLSYGGYFSLYTAAADDRIKSVYSGAAFNDRNNVCFHDWSYNNSSNMFLDAEVVALCAPRKVWIDVGHDDNVFDYKYSVDEAKRAKKYYEIAGCPDNFVYNLWYGAHKFDESGKGFEFFFNSLK